MTLYEDHRQGTIGVMRLPRTKIRYVRLRRLMILEVRPASSFQQLQLHVNIPWSSARLLPVGAPAAELYNSKHGG